MNSKIVLAIVTGSFFLACSHYDQVRPGPKGLHKVVLRGDTRSNVESDALDQTENYCDEFDKKPVIISEKTTFKGKGSEEDYLDKKGLADAARVGGGAASLFGDSTVKSLGGTAFVGGVAGSAYLGKPYLTVMKFRCK